MRNLISAIGILFFGLLLAFIISTSKPVPDKVIEAPPEALTVNAVVVESSQRSVAVTTHGLVEAEHQIDLISEVSGIVTAVNRSFIRGGLIKKNDVLLSVDPMNYETTLAQAKSTLAEAEEEEATQRALADQARKEWRDLGSQAANDLFLRQPQLARAIAKTTSAKAAVRQAEHDLKKTQLTLDFDAMMIDTQAHVGQYLAPGSKIATLYAKNDLMLELPLTQSQLEILNISWPIGPDNVLPEVHLTARVGGVEKHITADVKHSGAIFDNRNQLATLIVDVNDNSVLPGLYVEARITGNPRTDVIEINEQAFHDKRFVLVADTNHQVEFRPARQIGNEGDKVLLSAALKPGELVITDHIPLATPGMKVVPRVTSQP